MLQHLYTCIFIFLCAFYLLPIEYTQYISLTSNSAECCGITETIIGNQRIAAEQLRVNVCHQEVQTWCFKQKKAKRCYVTISNNSCII